MQAGAESLSTPSPVTAPAVLARAAYRIFCYVALLFWALVFGFLLLYAPWPVRLLALAWAAAGVLTPRFYLITLAASLPLFGNNPGGPHALYLLDMGLIGFVARDLGLKAAGVRRISPGAFDGLVRLFFLVSTITLFAQHKHIYCEAVVHETRFFSEIYTLFANAPMYGMRVWLDLALSLLFFAALRDDPPSLEWRRRIWVALLVALAAASVIGILEYFKVISLEFWRGENQFIAQFGYRRLQSLFWHSGWFAQYLTAIAPAALVLGLSGSAGAGGRKAKFLWLGLAGLFGLTVLLTFQRGGWLAFAASYGVVTLAALLRASGPGRRRMLGGIAVGFVAAAVITVALALLIPPLGHRLAEIARLEDRSKIWDSGFRLGTIYPLSGVGLGNYGIAHHYVYPAGSPYSLLDKLTPHNSYIYIFAERGIFAMAIFCVLLFGAITLLWRSTGVEQDGAARSEKLALLGALVAMAVYSIFQDISYIRVLEILLWLFLGLASSVVAASWIFSIGPHDKPWLKGAWVVAALAIACIVIRDERRYLEPFRVAGPDGQDYTAGGQVVRLALPKSASRVAVPVYCNDPNVRQAPVTFDLDLEGVTLGSTTFTSDSATSVTLALPPDRDHKAKLVIRASRAWSPFRYGMPQIPLLEDGVNYREPIVLP